MYSSWVLLLLLSVVCCIYADNENKGCVTNCEDVENGFYPACRPIGCELFVTCSDQIISYLKCPDEKAWDRNSKSCVEISPQICSQEDIERLNHEKKMKESSSISKKSAKGLSHWQMAKIMGMFQTARERNSKTEQDSNPKFEPQSNIKFEPSDTTTKDVELDTQETESPQKVEESSSSKDGKLSFSEFDVNVKPIEKMEKDKSLKGQAFKTQDTVDNKKEEESTSTQGRNRLVNPTLAYSRIEKPQNTYGAGPEFQLKSLLPGDWAVKAATLKAKGGNFKGDYGDSDCKSYEECMLLDTVENDVVKDVIGTAEQNADHLEDETKANGNSGNGGNGQSFKGGPDGKQSAPHMHTKIERGIKHLWKINKMALVQKNEKQDSKAFERPAGKDDVINLSDSFVANGHASDSSAPKSGISQGVISPLGEHERRGDKETPFSGDCLFRDDRMMKFDGDILTLRGDCRYLAVQVEDDNNATAFSVEVHLKSARVNSPVNQSAIDYVDIRINRRWARMHSVGVTFADGVLVSQGQVVDNEEYSALTGPDFSLVQTPDGVVATLDREHRFILYFPPRYNHKLKGLCVPKSGEITEQDQTYTEEESVDQQYAMCKSDPADDGKPLQD